MPYKYITINYLENTSSNSNLDILYNNFQINVYSKKWGFSFEKQKFVSLQDTPYRL